MKSFLFLVGTLSLLSFSGKWVQFYHLKPISPMTINGDSCVFETDTIRIVYDFSGYSPDNVGFTVLNKLSVPIYFNEYKSYAQRNQKKFPYWIEKDSLRGYYETIKIAAGERRLMLTVSNNDRIALLHPNLVQRASKEENLEIKDASAARPIKFYTLKCIEENTPLKFMNSLTFSTSANLDNAFNIDNTFYVDAIYCCLYKYWHYLNGLDERVSSPSIFNYSMSDKYSIANKKKW